MALRPVSQRIDDNYWRLTKYDGVKEFRVAELLREAGYYCPASWNRARVMEVAVRKETSRPEYRGMKKGELRKYAIARKTLASPKKASVKELRDSLYAADASPVFAKLFDLPTELRLRIYDFYFCDFPEILHHTSQPPLARLSPSLKEEVLSHFYKSLTFSLRLLYIKPAARSTHGTITLDPESLLFLYSLSPANLAILGHLRINIACEVPTYTRRSRIVEWADFNVTMRGADTPVRVEGRKVSENAVLPLCSVFPPHVHWELKTEVLKCQGELLMGVEGAVRTVLRDVGYESLRMSEVLSLMGAIQGVLRDVAERIKWW